MKFDIDSFREIGDSLLRNRRRSLLTGFGVFWGVFMLLFLVGGGNGLKEMLSSNFKGFATNTCIMVSSNTSRPYDGLPEGRYWQQDRTDMERLKMLVPELEVVCPMISAWGREVVYGSRSTQCGIKGVAPSYALIETPQLKYGRYINAVDEAQERKVCIIGKRIYNELFPEGGDPCGQFIQLGSVYLQVIGVDFNSGMMSINGEASRSLMMPFSLAAKLYNRGNTVDIICVTGKQGVKMSLLEQDLRNVMARRHRFDPDDREAMMVINTEQMFAIVDNLFKALNFLIWLIGIGTLLAGCIGVSNIMMVTVRERTVEIGIRRAIGAVPREILSQIMLESVALTVVSGGAGIVFSVLLLNVMEMVTKSMAFQISFSLALLSAALLGLLGAVAGLMPALRAMAVKPVDAMRDE